jgi:hypothetical protein
LVIGVAFRFSAEHTRQRLGFRAEIGVAIGVPANVARVARLPGNCERDS